MKKVIVVGSGAGGATIARELQDYCQVTILEAGKNFRSFKYNIKLLEKFKKTGLFFDERLIQLIYPFMNIKKSGNGMVVVSGRGTGGTTTLSTGTALRADDSLKEIGINLKAEYEELYQEVPITDDHQNKWNRITGQLYDVCNNMNLAPFSVPKMGNYAECTGCGRCVLGCNNVKWDCRCFLKDAVKKGAELITGCRVKNIIIANGKAVGVKANNGWKSRNYYADLIILAAGGLGTPEILNNSGISCKNKLFVDPVLCLAARKEKAFQNKEISMPFIVEKNNFIISPYFDYLSFFFNDKWNYPAQDIISLMIKLADKNEGRILNGNIDKKLTEMDKKNLQNGIELCYKIYSQLGIKREEVFMGSLNAGHPGGMMPLTESEKDSLHNPVLPVNLYISDSTLLPRSVGKPLIFTIMALAKKISKNCLNYL